MMNALILAGAGPDQARTYTAATRGKADPPTFMEFYGRGSIVGEANRARRCLNIKGLHALDLRTFRPDGTHWDFNDIKHRRDARRMVRDLKPTWIIGSPPCTAFSIWNFGINYKKMNHVEVARMLEEGRSHLEFMASIYRQQLKHGRHFLHEHPASAFSWREQCMNELLNHKRVYTVTCDQCQFGLTTKGDVEGERMPAMKPTKFITTSPQMIEQLGLRCDRSHKHRHLTGGRCAETAFYPLPLIRAILKGIAKTRDFEESVQHAKSINAEFLSAMKAGDNEMSLEPKLSVIPHTFVKRCNSDAKIKVDFEPEHFKNA